MVVPFIRPVMPSFEDLTTDLQSIIDANWYSNFGPKERLLRAEIEHYVGNGVNAVTLSNATSGIMAALSALLPRGDGRNSIAIASFTFAAGAQAILWHGYRPAWFDIDEATLQPSISSFRDLLEHDDQIAGILLTNTFGIGNTEIDSWERLATELELPLIIDSAAGFGSRYPNEERLGARGNCEIFSFHATKPFAIGEGGAITTRDPELAERMRQFTNFGFSPPSGATALGLNAKLTELGAAIGLRQLQGFEGQLFERRAILNRYKSALATLPIEYPTAISDSSICFASLLLNSPEVRDLALSHLKRDGVDARVYYAPLLHEQSVFHGTAPVTSLRVTRSVADRVLSLPVISDMSDVEIGTVVGAIRSAHTSIYQS